MPVGDKKTPIEFRFYKSVCECTKAFLSEYLLYDVELDFDTVDSMLNKVILKHQHIFQKWNVNISEIGPK